MRLDDEIVMLYRKARKDYLEGFPDVATQLYRRLRSEHAVELFYEVELPEHFKVVHPIGSVLGRATYGDYLVVYNGVSVGSTLDGERPTLGKGVVLFPGARVLGKSVIGDNVFVQAGTIIFNETVPSNVVCYTDDQGLAWKPTTRSVIKEFFEKENTNG